MPIYIYRCPKCSIEEEAVLPIDNRDDARLHCGEVMQRIMTVPQPPIIKKTGRDMALESLNSRDTDYIKPQHKRLAAQGLKKPDKTLF